MTHFGITALGAPNSFQSGLCSALGINVFAEEEFAATFRRYAAEDGCINSSQVEDLLHDTFGFPPLEEEVVMISEKLEGDRVSWAQFWAVIEELQRTTKSKAGCAKEYTSYEKMRQDRFKNIRMNTELQNKYKVPLTSAQSYGFYTNDAQQMEISKQVSFPVVHCAETKYAEEMTKSGFLFN